MQNVILLHPSVQTELAGCRIEYLVPFKCEFRWSPFKSLFLKYPPCIDLNNTQYILFYINTNVIMLIHRYSKSTNHFTSFFCRLNYSGKQYCLIGWEHLVDLKRCLCPLDLNNFTILFSANLPSPHPAAKQYPNTLSDYIWTLMRTKCDVEWEH